MAIDSTLNSRNNLSGVAATIVHPGESTRQLGAEQASVQHVAGFSVNYEHPFLKNERETQNMASSANAQSPGALQSVAIYTSKPSCGISEARLVVATYAQGVTMNIDGAANGSIAQVSTLDGITNPESAVTPITISGLPARKVSYRAKRRGGVIGVDSIVVSAPSTNTFWQFQLIFVAGKTNNYAALSVPQSCAQEIFNSIVIEA